MDALLTIRSKADSSVRESKLPPVGRVLVGRGPDCVVLLDGQGISREHLAVEADDSAVFIVDMSSNGTWLNGKRLSQNGRSKVEQGDLIELPGYEIRLHTSEPAMQQTMPIIRQDALTPAAPESFSGSLTWLDKFTILTALLSVALLLIYINS